MKRKRRLVSSCMHRVAGFGGVGSDSIRSGSGDLISSSMHRVAGFGGIGSDSRSGGDSGRGGL